jgi:hypothetical protein
MRHDRTYLAAGTVPMLISEKGVRKCRLLDCARFFNQPYKFGWKALKPLRSA